MAISIQPPPKLSPNKWYKEVTGAYMEIDPSELSVRGRSSVRKRVKAHGIDEVTEVIRFYAGWLEEDAWRSENMKHKGADWFMAFKFDEVRKIMLARNSKLKKYDTIGNDDQYVDPFRH